MAGVPLSDTERMRIRVLHGRGWSATAIGKELGRPTSTVTRAANSMDLHFDHAQTDSATRAAMITSAARATRVAERMLREAEDCLDSIHRPYMAWDFANNGESRYSEHLVMPGPAEKAQLMRAAQTGLSEYRRQTDFDRVLAGGGDPAAGLNSAVIGGLADRVHAALAGARDGEGARVVIAGALLPGDD